MSKNFPHDNMYSILGKLQALEPTPAEVTKEKAQAIRESVESQGSILKGLREVSSTEQRLTKQFAESKIEEKAVSKAQQKFMGMVHAAQKGEKAASPEVAKVAKSMGKKDAKDFASTKHKGLPQHVEESGQLNFTGMSKQEALAKTEDFVKMSATKLGVELSPHDLYALSRMVATQVFMGRSERSIKSHLQRALQSGSAIEEETCNECGMCESECGCDHTNEGEITRKPGVTRHEKTDYPGYPADDLEDPLDNLAGPGGKRGRPRKASTVNPRRDPNAPKKGRGRPAKASSTSSTSIGNDPFGRVPSKAPKGKPGRVHSMMESVNFKRMMEEQHMTLEEMLECMNADMMQFKESGVCSDRLRDMMEVYAHSKRQMEETQGGIGQDLITPQQRVAQATPQKPGVVGAVKDVAKGLGNWVQGKPEQGPTYEDLALEEELNELAKLAGLSTEGNAFTGKLKSTPKGGKFELDGEEYTDTSTLDEEPNEGNAFTAKLKDTPKGGEFELDGKKYKDTSSLDEAEVDVEDAPESANTPHKKKYFSMKGSTLNPGEADSGEKQMNPDRPTFKNGDNALSKPPVREDVFTLESQLAAEYESIKKSS